MLDLMVISRVLEILTTVAKKMVMLVLALAMVTMTMMMMTRTKCSLKMR